MDGNGEEVYRGFIEALWGEEVIKAIWLKAGPSTPQGGQSRCYYLLQIASQVLDVPVADLTQAFGRFAFTEFARGSREVLTKDIEPHEKIIACQHIFRQALTAVSQLESAISSSTLDSGGRQLKVVIRTASEWYPFIDGLVQGFEHFFRVPMVAVGRREAAEGEIAYHLLIRFGRYLRE